MASADEPENEKLYGTGGRYPEKCINFYKYFKGGIEFSSHSLTV
jgi:hypothetical protein